VYLPQATTPATIIQPAVDLAPAPHDSGIILLVEDDALVRALAGRILRTRGYQVLEAHDGATALHIAAAHRGQIDVLLTDVIMPGGLSGPQVAEQLLTQQAGLRVLYMSGYTDTMIAHHAAFDPRQNLLQKPFTPTGLVRAVWNARYARPQENVDVYEADEKA
jgi:two-component system cell cycle sensor histidine kinase/response regulator CckA